MTVTPVAKLPIALRNSACVTPIRMGSALQVLSRMVSRCFLFEERLLLTNLMYDFGSVTAGQTTWTKQLLPSSHVEELRFGMDLSRERACHLIRCSEDQLPTLLGAAMDVRRRFKLRVVTYSRK